MSLYCEIETEFKDQDCLVEALEGLGFKGKVERHVRPVALEGYRGDVRSQKAQIVVRRSNIGLSSNDLGFVKDQTGRYRLIVSEYDRDSGYGDAWMAKLKARYFEIKTVKDYRRRGYRLVERRADAQSGRTIIRLARHALPVGLARG